MKIESILAELDAEIARLTQVRKLLAGYGSATVTTKIAAKATTKSAKKRRNLSTEARKRIAEAQKRRWAAQRAKKKDN